MNINIELNTHSVENAIKKLQDYKKKIKVIESAFIQESLDWIIERANYYLDLRDTMITNFETTDIRNSWQKVKIGTNTWQIINLDDRATYAEFGTGLVGSNSPHARANDNSYAYDVNNHGEEGWTFYNKDAGIYMEGFTGYKGKSFLYDACYDYFEKGEYQRIYTRIAKAILG